MAAADVATLEAAFQLGQSLGLGFEVDGEFFQERLASFLHGGRERRERGAQARFAEAAELARLRAEKTLEGIEGGKTIAELAEATDRETEESQAFTRQGAFVRGIGNLPGIRELAFATEQGQPLSRVFTSRGKAYVFVVSAREQADPESFDETRDDLLKRLRDERVQETFTELLTTLKGRTEIVYNQDTVRTLVP